MPKAPRLCPGDDGHCTNLITTERRCEDCEQPQHWRGPRTTSSTITGTRAWRRLRAQVLKRDNHQCQVRITGICTGRADCVHHIKNTAAGGAPYDPTNCAAACTPCNQAEAYRESATARAQRRAQHTAPLHPGLVR